MIELAWAAALFVGEGSCACHSKKRKDGGSHVYIKLGMYDKRAVERFRSAVEPAVLELTGNLHPYVSLHHLKPVRSGIVKDLYTVDVGGRPALAILRSLWPYLKDTDKGDQILRALDNAKIPKELVTHAG